MSAAEELRREVAARAEGTPYEVVPTDKGFDLRIKVVDARWLGPYGASGRKRVVQYEVALDEATMTMTLTDQHFDLTWSIGAQPTLSPIPQVRASAVAQKTRGRRNLFATEHTIGMRSQSGKDSAAVDYTFRSADGHRMIREPARTLGWHEKRGTEQKIGITVAVIAGIGALVVLAAVAFSLFS